MVLSLSEIVAFIIVLKYLILGSPAISGDTLGKLQGVIVVTQLKNPTALHVKHTVDLLVLSDWFTRKDVKKKLDDEGDRTRNPGTCGHGRYRCATDTEEI